MNDVPTLDTYKLQWQITDLKQLVDRLEQENTLLKLELNNAKTQLQLLKESV